MFRFRLQRVLELREKHEQAKAVELSAAETVADSARRDRDELAALKENSRGELSAAHDAAPRVGHLHQLGMVLDSISQRLEHAGEAVVNAEALAADARTALENAARDRRVLDRLKGKHETSWTNEEQARDRIQMDAIALARYAQARQGNTSGDNTGRKGDSVSPSRTNEERA